MDNLTKLQNIFRDFFDDENLLLTPETSPEDIEDWDSLAQINIIVTCETEFNIKFDVNEITNIKNVGDILTLIQNKQH